MEESRTAGTSYWREELPWLNACVSLASYVTFPELILEWKSHFGLGTALTLLTVSSVLSRVAGAAAFPWLASRVGRHLRASALGLATLGVLGFTARTSFPAQFLAMWAVGLAHGVWTSSLQTHIVRSASTPEDAARSSSHIQLLSNVGVALGGLASTGLMRTLGFGGAATVSTVLFGAMSAWAMIRARRERNEAPDVELSPRRRDESHEGEAPSSARRRWTALLPAGAGILLFLLAYSSINFLMPLRARELDDTLPVGTFFTANALVVIAFQPVFGKLRSLHAPRRALRLAAALLAAGVATLAAPGGDIVWLYAFVLFLSLAEVLVFPGFDGLTKALVRTSGFPARRMSSLYTGVRVLGLGGGSVVWPLLTQAGGMKPVAFALGAVVVGWLCFETEASVSRAREATR